MTDDLVRERDSVQSLINAARLWIKTNNGPAARKALKTALRDYELEMEAVALLNAHERVRGAPMPRPKDCEGEND